MRNFVSLLLFVTLFAAVGCGSGYNTCEVEGNVLFKGQPVPYVDVEFAPVAGERSSVGTSDENGHYQMRYTRKDLGVERGKHKVILTIPPREGGKDPSDELKAAVAKYTADASPLELEITKSNKSLNIEIEP